MLQALTENPSAPLSAVLSEAGTTPSRVRNAGTITFTPEEEVGLTIKALSLCQEMGCVVAATRIRRELREMFPIGGPSPEAAAALAGAEAWLAEAREFESAHGIGSRLNATHPLVVARESFHRAIASRTPR